MDKIEFKYSDWRVFLDGVEIPHLGLSVSFSEGQISQANILLEPDALIMSFRPGALIHIWARDFYVKKDTPEERTYRLYWEGLYSGYQYTKQPTGRNISITGSGIMQVFRDYKAFSIGIGSMLYGSVLSGSNLLPVFASDSALSLAGQGNNLFRLSLMQDRLVKNNQPAAEMIKNAIGYLAAHNALLRQTCVRLRLLDKIVGVDDDLYGKLIQIESYKEIMGDLANDISETSSVSDIIERLQGYVFHKTVHVPFPYTPPTKVTPGRYDSPILVTEPGVKGFPRRSPRNDLCIQPDTFFALPPPCNFIFPDQVAAASLSRDYLVEPTRYFLKDPYAVFGGLDMLSVMAPASILANKPAGTTTQDLVGLLIPAVDVRKADPSSVYIAEGKNLLSYFNPYELERGMLSYIGTSTLENRALANSLSRVPPGADTTRRPIVQDLVTELNNTSYKKETTALAHYLFQLSQFSGTQGTLSLSGNRWLIPGWPAIIFDKTVSYICHIVSVNTSVAVTGLETTNVSIDKLRPVPRIDAKFINTIKDRLAGVSTKNAEVLTKRKELAARLGNNPDLQTPPRFFDGGTVTPVDPENDPIVISLRGEIKKLSEELGQVSDGVADDLSVELDVPVPPAFFNKELLELSSLDNLYKTLFGCVSFYTSEYAREISPVFLTIDDELEDATELRRLRLFLSYIKGLLVINEVFPFYGERQGKKTLSWDDLGRNNIMNPGEWAENSFLKREGTTLEQFLSAEALKEEFPGYTVLRPVTKSAWDDTIFSKLVDEGALAGEVPDVGIERVRSDSFGKFLRTSERQSVVERYTQKHYTKLGYDGR